MFIIAIHNTYLQSTHCCRVLLTVLFSRTQLLNIRVSVPSMATWLLYLFFLILNGFIDQVYCPKSGRKICCRGGGGGRCRFGCIG